MSDRAPEPLVIQEDETLAGALRRYTQDHPDTLFRAETARGPVTGRIAAVSHGYHGWATTEPAVTLERPAGEPAHLDLRDLREIYPLARIRPDGTPGPLYPSRHGCHLGGMQIFPRSYQGDPEAADFLDDLRDYLMAQHKTPAMRLETAEGARTVWITAIGPDHLLVRDLDAWDLGAFAVTPEALLNVYAEGVICKASGEVVPTPIGRVSVLRPHPAAPGLAVDSLPPSAHLDPARRALRKQELADRLADHTVA